MSTDERKVISISGKPVRAPGEAHPDVVKRLEDLLEMARSGEICGIAMVYEYRDEGYSWGCAGRFSRGRIIGGIEALKFKITRDLVDE